MERACYGCFGPAELPNAASLARQFARMGLAQQDIARRFLFITSAAAPFSDIGLHYREQEHD
jgi:hypothetical protein